MLYFVLWYLQAPSTSSTDKFVLDPNPDDINISKLYVKLGIDQVDQG